MLSAYADMRQRGPTNTKQEELLKVRRTSQEQWDLIDRQRHTQVAALQEDKTGLVQQLEELKGQLKTLRCWRRTLHLRFPCSDALSGKACARV